METQKAKRLQAILDTLSIQEKVSTKPTLLIQRNLDKTMKKSLSNKGYRLLNREINNLVQKQQRKIKENSQVIQEKQFNQMKHKLKLYGKNRYEFLIDKIIQMDRKEPQPLKNIAKVKENKFLIAKQYNIRLSQKVDAIIQSQNIAKMKQQQIKHLHSKNQAPLVNRLRNYQSTHEFKTFDLEQKTDKDQKARIRLFNDKKLCIQTQRTARNSSGFTRYRDIQRTQRVENRLQLQTCQRQKRLQPQDQNNQRQSHNNERQVSYHFKTCINWNKSPQQQNFKAKRKLKKQATQIHINHLL